MSMQERKAFIKQMYEEVFTTGDVAKVPKFFASDYRQETNYDVLDHEDFIEHIKDLSEGPAVAFDLDFLVITESAVVVRAIVREEKQISGAPPVALLISVWEFNEQGLVNYCKEVADG